MKSTANIDGHPIHPILVNFPIAFFTGTVVFDVLAQVTGNYNLSKTARNLEIAGIAGAVAAAVPGLIDYIYTVPPQSSAKKRAAKHGLTNSAALLLFSAALGVRRRANPYAVLAIETAGLACMVSAGWMGGTLVYRNQIGVYNRYADLGKWKETYIDTEQSRIEVGHIDELKADQMKLVHINGKRIVIGRAGNDYVAFDDRCTHRGGSLAGGTMICGTVQCPWHGSQFNTRTGEVAAGPAEENIATYPIHVEGDRLYLTLQQ